MLALATLPNPKPCSTYHLDSSYCSLPATTGTSRHRPFFPRRAHHRTIEPPSKPAVSQCHACSIYHLFVFYRRHRPLFPRRAPEKSASSHYRATEQSGSQSVPCMQHLSFIWILASYVVPQRNRIFRNFAATAVFTTAIWILASARTASPPPHFVPEKSASSHHRATEQSGSQSVPCSTYQLDSSYVVSASKESSGTFDRFKRKNVSCWPSIPA